MSKDTYVCPMCHQPMVLYEMEERQSVAYEAGANDDTAHVVCASCGERTRADRWEEQRIVEEQKRATMPSKRRLEIAEQLAHLVNGLYDGTATVTKYVAVRVGDVVHLVMVFDDEAKTIERFVEGDIVKDAKDHELCEYIAQECMTLAADLGGSRS